jgi:hypothetical protein
MMPHPTGAPAPRRRTGRGGPAGRSVSDRCGRMDGCPRPTPIRPRKPLLPSPVGGRTRTRSNGRSHRLLGPRCRRPRCRRPRAGPAALASSPRPSCRVGPRPAPTPTPLHRRRPRSPIHRRRRVPPHRRPHPTVTDRHRHRIQGPTGRRPARGPRPGMIRASDRRPGAATCRRIASRSRPERLHHHRDRRALRPTDGPGRPTPPCLPRTRIGRLAAGGERARRS